MWAHQQETEKEISKWDKTASVTGIFAFSSAWLHKHVEAFNCMTYKPAILIEDTLGPLGET